MGKKNSIVVGLDIGTSKICAAVGEMTERGLEIIGIGLHPSQGLRKGVVINIETTVNSLKKAVEEASLMAGCEIHTVFTSISGGHIKAFNSHGIVAVKNKEVMARDLERVIDAAKAVAIPMDREVLHVLPQDYIIDDQDGIRDPLGMSGVRLEAKVHIVTGAVASAQNVIKCCNRAGLNVAEIVLAPLAAADAVLTDEERELGVVLVDVGGGTTDIAVYHDGTVKHTAVVPIGGNHITNDIAAGLRTAFNDAERLKQRYGCARASMVSGTERVEVPCVASKGAGTISRQILCEIVEPRLAEIFELVQKEVTKSGYEGSLASGIVATGGTMLLAGAVDMADRSFGLPVRLGTPARVGGLVDIIDSPIHAAAVGLTLHGVKRQDRSAAFRVREDKILSKVKHRMSDWLSDFF
ncbi:MAG: cell division protein FtsA [Betaproteobacteria bacterium]|jgi:cell division protein FtsA|nr:cell division protein FtsA [Candidatus Binatia bacterium]